MGMGMSMGMGMFMGMGMGMGMVRYAGSIWMWSMQIREKSMSQLKHKTSMKIVRNFGYLLPTASIFRFQNNERNRWNRYNYVQKNLQILCKTNSIMLQKVILLKTHKYNFIISHTHQ